MLVAAIVALARGHSTAAAVYAGAAILSAVAVTLIFQRVVAWQGMGRAGHWRMALSWGSIALCQWAVAYAFWSTDFIGSIVFLTTGWQPFLIGGTAYTTVQHLSRIADALGPGERLLAFCTGGVGPRPQPAVLAATDRRVVLFRQPGLRPQVEALDSVERSEVADVDISQAGVVRVASRTGDHELVITHAPEVVAETFVRQMGAAGAGPATSGA
jgi:hypothetical protein